MAKIKKYKARRLPQQYKADSLDSKLDQIDRLIAQHKYAEAIEQLEQLAQQHPRNPEVWVALSSAALEAKDSRTLLRAAIRLSELSPNDPDIMFNLAGAYMTNIFPALATVTLREAVARWPDHPRAAKARHTLAELERQLKDNWTEANLPPDKIELAVLHERVQIELNSGRYAKARQLAEQLVESLPRFAAPLNNISLAYFVEGNLPEAIAAARRVLDECDPDNFHALSNLVHYLCLLGQMDEARAYAERLKAVQSSRVDVWVKKAEAFAYLDDNEQVLQIFKEAEEAGMLKPPLADPFLIHLAAAAHARLGHEAEAVRLWRRALQIAPAFAPAQENLQDLKRPVGERNGPWAIPFTAWMPPAYGQALIDLLKPVARRQNEAEVEQAARQFLNRHPYMNTLVPVLLSHGDPQAVNFAVLLARMAETPEMHAALKDFALGQHGPDKKRMEVAQVLASAGVLPTNKPVKMWVKGQWGENLLMTFRITDEPKEILPDNAQLLLHKMRSALQKGKLDEAEQLVRQALDQAPGSISIQQNLAAIYAQRGEIERAETILRQLVERKPDYIIGRCNLAQIAIDRKNYAEAEEWLAPVMNQQELHIIEFNTICQAHIRLELAQGRREAAQGWLNMWATVSPDHPDIRYWRAQLALGKRHKDL